MKIEICWGSWSFKDVFLGSKRLKFLRLPYPFFCNEVSVLSLIFRYSIYFIHQQVVYKASKIEIEKRKRNKGLADSCITVTIVIDFDRRNKWITRLSAHLVTGITMGSNKYKVAFLFFTGFSYHKQVSCVSAHFTWSSVVSDQLAFLEHDFCHKKPKKAKWLLMKKNPSKNHANKTELQVKWTETQLTWP